MLIEDWRIDYNVNRPHSAHGDLTPSPSMDRQTPTSARIATGPFIGARSVCQRKGTQLRGVLEQTQAAPRPDPSMVTEAGEWLRTLPRDHLFASWTPQR